MATKIHFTKASIEKLSCPKNKIRQIYRDDEIASLELEVFKSGKKTFYLYKRIGSSPTRIKLGVFPDLGVDRARSEAQKKLGEIALGNNPADSKRRQRQEITFAKLFEMFMEKHSKLHKKSHKLDQELYDRHLKSWFGNLKLSSINAEKVREFNSSLGAYSKAAANRTLALLSTVINKAIEWELYNDRNPVEKIQKFKAQSRDRFLHPDEMPRFFAALAQETNETARDFIMAALYTGARKSNVLSMRWDELNLEAEKPYWRIPGDKSKNAEFMLVSLSPEAIPIIERRKINAPHNNPFVFYSNNKLGHLIDPKKAWKRILTKAEIKDLRIHDLRRTFGSWLAASGANSFMIGKALGHKSIKSTAIYARLSIDPVSDSINKATEAMTLAGKIKPKKTRPGK